MVTYLSKLLNIRPAEWPRLAWLYTMHFIYITGLVWGELILEASFLQQIGVEKLSFFFIAKAIVSLPMVMLYSAFADRVANDRLLIAILLGGAGVIITGLIFLSFGFQFIAYPLLYVTVFVPFYDIYASHWFTYANDFYDTRAAKRVIPVLSTSLSAAGICGGLTLPILNSYFAPTSIIIIWLCALLTVALLAWLMPYVLSDKPSAPDEPDYIATSPQEAEPSYMDNLREGYSYVIHSPFLRWMALSALLFSLSITFLQYRSSAIFLEELKTIENISNYTGRLTSISNIVILTFQSLFLSRIMSRVGLGNANLIFPVGTLIISSSLIFVPNLITAALAFINRTEFAALGYSINSLLYNAVPLRIKGRARAFITGAILPLGPLLVGLLLSIPFLNNTWFVAGVLGIVALAYVGSEWMVRQEYSRALLKMLAEEDFSTLFSQQTSKLSLADPTALNELRKKLAESPNHEFTVFIAKLISELGGQEAIPILATTLHQTPEGRTRAALIDVLILTEARNAELVELFTHFLADEETQVRLSAIRGLEHLLGGDSEQFLTLTQDKLTDPEVEVQVQILSALVQRPDFIELKEANQALRQLRYHREPHYRARGVQVFGQFTINLTAHRLTNVTRTVFQLTNHLNDAEDQVRLQAALAVEELSKNSLTDQLAELLIQQMSDLINDPVERIRQATLTVFSQLGKTEATMILVPALKDPSPQVRNTAANLIVAIGKSAIPRLHPQLNAAIPQERKMTAIILSRINKTEYGPLVQSYITGNLIEIYTNYQRLGTLKSLTQYHSGPVLRDALRDHNHHLIDEVFSLLRAIHPPKTINLIVHSLKNSEKRVRANAVEALEGLTTPQTAQLIGQLFEDNLGTTRLLHLGQDTWDIPILSPKEVIRALLTDPENKWFRALTAFTLSEIGLSLKPKEPPAATSTTKKKSKRARKRPPAGLDLLGALTEDTDDDAETPKKRCDKRKNPLAALAAAIEEESPEEAATQKESSPKQSQQDERPSTRPAMPLPNPLFFTLPEIETLLQSLSADDSPEVQEAVQAANRHLAGFDMINSTQEAIVLSAVEKIIFLKGVPFFQDMTIDQLTVLANVCEEKIFEEDVRIFNEGDPGGTLYVVVSGRVGIEQEKRKGSFARLATIEAHSYFGETNLFDNSPQSVSAIALQDTLTLRLRREPLIALARQYPELSLKLINVLSQRLREANDRVADLTRTRPRELHKLFDQFE